MKCLWSWPELAKLFPRAHILTAHAIINGISIDSRTLKAGDLFIALKGPLQDGHDHVAQAVARGAAAVLVEHRCAIIEATFPQIVVEDTFKALYDLAAAARARALTTRIIGITGSFGKTSSREALRHILQHYGSVHTTERNFNNHWGLPLSLARLNPDNRYAIFEMGMNHAHEITPLSQLVRPHMSLITTIGDAHIANFGSREAIADAKAEIFMGMDHGGQAVLNSDDPEYPRLAAAAQDKNLTIVTFGHNSHADFRVAEAQYLDEQWHITLSANHHDYLFTMNVLGDHWSANMAGVMACAAQLEINPTAATQHLKSFQPLAGRGMVHKIPYKNDYIQVIDDSYNAGPMAMQSALQSLARVIPSASGRRLAILGDMVDQLDMVASHQALASFFEKTAVDQAYLYGPYMCALYDILPSHQRGGHYTTVNSLIADLIENIQPGDCILVKGARGQRAYDSIMKSVVDALLQLGNDHRSAATHHPLDLPLLTKES